MFVSSVYYYYYYYYQHYIIIIIIMFRRAVLCDGAYKIEPQEFSVANFFPDAFCGVKLECAQRK